MSEKATVTPVVQRWLTEKGYLALTEFELEGGRVDLLGCRWSGSHELDCVGVECKRGNVNIREIDRLLREQVTQYQRSIPFCYLAIPERTKLGVIKALCEVHHAGLLVVDQEKAREERRDEEINPSFDGTLFVSNVRPRMVMPLAFKELFGGEDVALSPNWCAKPKRTKVQFNTHITEKTHKMTLFGVNVEDIRNAKIEATELHDALSETKVDAYVQLRRQNYFTRGAATIMPLISKKASQLTEQDLQFISKSTKANRNMHLEIHVKVWDNWEVLSRPEHVERMTKAMNSLTNLLNYFKSTFRQK